jgi:hypothetical protein
MFLLKAGMAYELLGEYGNALKCFERIKFGFANSNEARDIDKFIARATSKK